MKQNKYLPKIKQKQKKQLNQQKQKSNDVLQYTPPLYSDQRRVNNIFNLTIKKYIKQKKKYVLEKENPKHLHYIFKLRRRKGSSGKY